MRDAAVLSFAVYLIAWWILIGQFGIEGLLSAMIIYVIARALALLIFYPSLLGSVGV
jgi:MATE family multidrug resistance protein